MLDHGLGPLPSLTVHCQAGLLVTSWGLWTFITHLDCATVVTWTYIDSWDRQFLNLHILAGINGSDFACVFSSETKVLRPVAL